MDVADALEVVSFRAGEFRFAVEARQVDGVCSEMPESVLFIESLLGLFSAEGVQRRCLRVGKNHVVVSEPLDLLQLPVESLYPLPELVAARLQIKAVKALALEVSGVGGVMLLVDLQALLEHSEVADNFSS